MAFVRNFEATFQRIMSICIDTYIFPRWESPKSHESEVGRKAGICRAPADADARAWQLLLTVELGYPLPIRPGPCPLAAPQCKLHR